MFDGFRVRMGRRALHAAVQARRARALPESPSDRKVLILLPVEEYRLRETWPFVEALDIALANLTCVVLSERVAYAPDRFAGTVQRLPGTDLDWRGLPRAEVLVALQHGADVAINLSGSESLAAEFLVGASSAGLRIGPYREGAEAFYDLMLAGADSASELVGTLRRVLSQINPPIVPVH